MPKTIAEERITLLALVTKPEDPSNPTVAELSAGMDLSLKVLFSDFRLSPTASDTVNEPALGEGGNSSAPGKTNYEGTISLFRFIDKTTGLAVAAEDDGWDLMREKGSEIHFYKRMGPHITAPFESGQPVEYFHALTDIPQDPSDLSGYLKKTIPLLVQGDSNMSAEVAAA